MGASQFQEKIKQAKKKLKTPQKDCTHLLDYLDQITEEKSQPIKKVKRLYVDGVFDLTHSGHFNALRQCKMLCDELVLGVVSDQEVLITKGPPIFNVDERMAIASSCKWVD